MMTDQEIENIIANLESEAIGYCGKDSKIQQNRAMLLRRYNRELYGDEIEGQSKVVTSDVFDVVESALPHLIRLFLQGRNICKFTANKEEAVEEAQQKTDLVNYVFKQQHKPVRLLHSMFKDALLQYTGTLETYWDDKEEYIDGEDYFNLSEIEYRKLQLDKNFDIKEIEEVEQGFNVKGVRTNKSGRIKIQPRPPNEVVISKRAHDFQRPPFYGTNTVKTRSELLQMGFDKKTIMELGEGDSTPDQVETERNSDISSGSVNKNPTRDKSQDTFRLGEYYTEIDCDEDGIAEYYKVFFITEERKLLSKEMVDNHGLATTTCIPMPHRAIGECLASVVADHQYWHSTLVRNLNNNIYATNFSRIIINDRVDDDEANTPVAGGVVHAEGNAPVTGCIEPIVTIPQADKIIAAINLADTQKEKRTGITAYNQGMDTDALNKTATGFVGIRDMSQMRIELIARVLAEGVQMVCERIIELFVKHQDTEMQIMVLGKPITIDPTSWKYKTDCQIDIGVGGGERQERIQNLNFIFQTQMALKQQGSPLVDDDKLYNTLDKLTQQVGLFGAESYFNDPKQPDDVVRAQNEQLQAMVMQLQQQVQAMEPLTQSEQIRAQTALATKEMDSKTKIAQEQIKAGVKQFELKQADEHHDDGMAVELTKIEAQTSKNVPGSVI